MSGDAIEWVPGVPRWDRLFRTLSWAGLVFGSAVVAFAFLVLLGFVRGYPGGLTLPLTLLILLFAANSIYVSRFAQFHPGAMAIGVSPGELALRAPLGLRTYPWSEVRLRDETHLEIGASWRLNKILLSPEQSRAVLRRLPLAPTV